MCSHACGTWQNRQYGFCMRRFFACVFPSLSPSNRSWMKRAWHKCKGRIILEFHCRVTLTSCTVTCITTATQNNVLNRRVQRYVNKLPCSICAAKNCQGEVQEPSLNVILAPTHQQSCRFIISPNRSTYHHLNSPSCLHNQVQPCSFVGLNYFHIH